MIKNNSGHSLVSASAIDRWEKRKCVLKNIGLTDRVATERVACVKFVISV